jgi:hypothetical protein
MKKIVLTFLILFSVQVFSYVENVTKGYPNCMACHMAPNGGGILTDYGRSLSSELMSTWKVSEGFEKPFYGLGENTENIKFGGQYRKIQVHAENDQIEINREFDMQNNLEFAVKYMDTFLVATVGTKEGPEETPERGEFLSERHFLIWESSEDSRVRVGKFRQHFGINQTNHTRLAKASLGFGSNSETYNLEFSKYYEDFEINTSSSFGKMFSSEEEDEGKRNFVFNYTNYLAGDARIGGSYLIGKSENYKRNIMGVNAVFPIGENGVGRSEVNLEQKSLISAGEVAPEISALYGDHQYGYRFFKGGMGYFIFEHGQSDMDDHELLVTSPGIGFQFLPIPHVEILVEYQKRTYHNDLDNPEHRSFALVHLYH